MVTRSSLSIPTVLAFAVGLARAIQAQPVTASVDEQRPSQATPAAPVGAPRIRSSGEFQGPSQRLLADPSATELTLVVPEDFHPKFITNVGAVEGARETSPGRWTLQYVPPEERYPQVALIVAQSPKTYEPVIFRMELHGSPAIHFKSEPNIEVNVHIAGEVFGPVRTNGKGEGHIVVNVPPGVVTAETRGTDAHGNTNTETIALDVPSFSRFLLLCADSSEAVYLVSTDPKGRLSVQPAVELLASHGVLRPARKIAPGLFAVVWESKPGDPKRAPLTLTARTESNGGSVSQCKIAQAQLSAPPRIPTPSARDPFPAQSSWARLGLRLGLSTNGARVTGPWASIRLDTMPLRTVKSLVVGVEVGVVGSSSSSTVLDGEPLDIAVLGIPAIGRLGYELTWSRASLQATMGVGLVFSTVTIEGESIAQQARDLSALVGGSLAPGVELGPGRLAVEVGYWLSNFDDPNISGNILGLNATVGYALSL